MTQTRMLDVLWIEDDARTDTTRYIPPVKQTFQYKLHIARDISEAVRYLVDDKKHFSVVIVDIRLPIGDDQRWKKIAPQNRSGARLDHKLGIELLYTLLNSPRAKVKLDIPDWIAVPCIGVFTIERYVDIQEQLTHLKIQRYQYRQKGARVGATALLELISAILDRSKEIS